MPGHTLHDTEYASWRGYVRQRAGRVGGLFKSQDGGFMGNLGKFAIGAAKDTAGANIATVAGPIAYAYRCYTEDCRRVQPREPTKPGTYSKSELFESTETTRAAARNA